MVQSFKEDKRITYFMCDRNQQLTLAMLVNLLMDISETQSAHLGRDEKAVKEFGYSWIIIHYDLTINRMPEYKEVVEIETYATEYNKLFTYRDFVVRNSEGTELVTVKTTFALMDLEKRKMARISEEVVEPYQANYSKRIRRNTKAGSVNLDEANRAVYSVRYFDIDGNNHVNNSHYFTWLLDSLDNEFLNTHKIRSGVVSFDKEVKENNQVISLSSHSSEISTHTDHQIIVDSVSHCSASFEWVKV